MHHTKLREDTQSLHSWSVRFRGETNINLEAMQISEKCKLQAIVCALKEKIR